VSELESEATTTAVYDAAADVFDHPVLTFWEAVGRGTVDCLDLAWGMEVLDVASGSGSSALAAAEIVGPGGRVVAASVGEAPGAGSTQGSRPGPRQRGDRRRRHDRSRVSRRVLRRGRVRVRHLLPARYGSGSRRALAHGETRRPARDRHVRSWRAGTPVRPFWEAVSAERPELSESRYNPWDDIDRPEQVADLFTSAGVPEPDIVPASHPTAVSSAHDWWAIVMGTGLRGTIGKLSPEAANRVRQANDHVVESMADVGIAIGAGTDVAIESANVILVRDDPRDVVRVIGLSRASYRKMLQNLAWATGYNVFAPAARGRCARVGGSCARPGGRCVADVGEHGRGRDQRAVAASRASPRVPSRGQRSGRTPARMTSTSLPTAALDRRRPAAVRACRQ